MKRSCLRWPVPVVLAVLAGSCAQAGSDGDGEGGSASGLPADTDSDSATLRRQAMNEWFNESSAASDPTGPWTHEYRKFMLGAAAVERKRWSDLLPSPDARFTPAAVTGTTWSNLGPTQAHQLKNGATTLNVTDSGRARSILVDGARIFVATAGGGVWRSLDGGGVWTPITESLGTLSCGSLAMDPSDHNTLYLGLGDPFDGTGIGFVKSTDGGNTWSAPVFLGDSTIIPQVLVHPTQTSTLLVATNKGLYRSTDSGASFAPVALATGQTEAPYVWSLASTGGHGFVLGLEALHSATTGTTDGQIWTSADDGATWTRAAGFTAASGVGRTTVAAAPSSPQTVYAMAAIPHPPTASASSDLADIFSSTDGGRTWTALGAAAKSYTNTNLESSKVGTLLNGQGWYDQLVLVSPTNPSLVYFGGALLLAKTADGGSTFTQVSNWLAQFSLPYVHADFHAGTFDADGNLYVGTDGGVFLSTDAGAHFTDALNIGIVTHLLYSVGSSPNNRSAVVGGMQDNGTRVREGTTSIFDEFLGGDGFGSTMHPSNAQLVLGSIYYDRIYKSTNGGSTFTSASSGIAESNNSSSAPFITRILPWEGSSTGNDVYTFSNTKVYKSTSFAGSWSAVGTALPVPTGGIIRNIGVAASNANVIGAVGSGGYVFLSTNGGSSWTTLAHGKTATDPTTALPNSNLSLSCIYFDRGDPSIIYVASVAPDATVSHLWRSTDSGATWIAIDGNGFPAGVPVNLVRSDPQSAGVLYAGTHLGVYRSTDGGASWNRFGAGMPLVSVTDLYISPDATLVRAATFGRGFWELGGGAVTNDFSLSASPSTVSAAPGASGTSTIATAVTAGSAQGVAFTVSGLPAGATASMAPASVSAGASATLTLTAGASTPVGSYTVTVTGTGASATHAIDISFTVTAPVANDFSLDASPTTVSVLQGMSGAATISTAVTSGRAQTVTLSATGLPAGATPSFAPPSVTAGGSAALTLTAGASTPPGSYAVVVTGTGTSATHTRTLTFVVAATPSDFAIDASPTTVSAVQGASGATTISTTVTSGAAPTIGFAVTGLPSGATPTFAPASVTAGGSASLTLSAAASTPVGSYTVTVTGTSASATHSKDIAFVVTAPVGNDFTISAAPGTVSMAPGGSGTTTIATAVTSGGAQTVTFSASGLPAGASPSFAPESVTAGGSAVLTLSAGAGTAPGTYPITITGTGASVSYTTGVLLTVTAPSGGAITNSDFETGNLAGWTQAGAASAVSSGHSGSYAARVGSGTPTNGDSSIAQTFTVPADGGTLSFWYLVHCPDTLVYDWGTATLKDNTTGTTTTVLSKTCTNGTTWKQASAGVIGGHSVTLTLISHDDDYAGDATSVDFDDVTLGAPIPTAVVNPGFENGLTGWTGTGTTVWVSAPTRSGSGAARVGSLSPSGDSTLAQTFTVPAGATKLTFWYRVVCPDSVTYDWATATLKDNTAGSTTTVLSKTCTNTGSWVPASASVTAGHSVTLTLSNRDDDYPGDATYTYLDDVALQ